MKDPYVIGIIPVRLNSIRFPRKVLAKKTGKTLVQHVWENVSKCKNIDRLVIAGDNQEIKKETESFGAEYINTSKSHKNGTTRCHEAFEILSLNKPSIIVNIQGDEPEIKASTIDSTIECLKKNNDCEVATPVCRISELKYIDDPNIVKVVCDNLGKALYFSRSAIPYNYKNDINSVKRHIGLYAYKSSFLEKFVSTPQSTLEKLEQLEQLRVLSMGAKIAVTEVSHSSGGIDTPEQYQDFVNRNKSLN